MTRNMSGQSILEVVLATTLIAVGLIAALALGNSSQKSASFSRNVNLATNYSYQVADWARNMRTYLGWSNFTYIIQEDNLTSVTYCLNSTLPSSDLEFQALTSASCAEGDTLSGTIFSRELILDLTNLATGTIDAKVTTSWLENTVHTNNLEFELTQWQ